MTGVIKKSGKEIISIFLFDQNCVDNAVLTWAADDLCFTKFGRDDCSLGHKVTADVVRVCCVFCNRADLDFLNFSGLLVADVCKLAAECTDLGVSAGHANGLYTGDPDDSICRGSADLEPFLPAGCMITTSGRFSY